jgi:hypothetical protein
MSKQNLDLGEHGIYTPGEVTLIIELLSALVPIDEIQERFALFTGDMKKVSGSAIQQIQLRYSDRIRKQNDMYLKNIDGNPLAHMKIRLDIYYRILRDSLKQRPSHSVKHGEDSYELVLKADNPTALNALKLAMQDMAKQRELDLLENKKVSKEGIEEVETEWDVNDGLTG